MSFISKYRALEKRMEKLCQKEGSFFLPNPTPSGPVQHVLICMEPSLGRWGRTKQEIDSKLESGFRNFISSIEDYILHYSVQTYLCNSTEEYHITDLSKGAMKVEDAKKKRRERYDEWYNLLQKEIELVAHPSAKIITVGNTVTEYLSKKDQDREIRKILHFSGQAGRARNQGLLGYEKEFKSFKSTVARGEIISTATNTLNSIDDIDPSLYNQIMERLKRTQLTESRKKLIFNYKLKFESFKNSSS